MARKLNPKRPSHYQQLSPAAWEVVSGREVPLQVDASLASYTGHPDLAPMFNKELEVLKAAVQGLPSAELFLQGYTLWANDPKKKRENSRQFYNMVSGLRKGVLQFMEAREYLQISPADMDTKWVTELIDWLKTAPRKNSEPNGKPRAFDYARRQYLHFAAVVTAIRNSPRFAHILHPKLSLPQEAFTGTAAQHKKTESLEKSVWLSIYDAAVMEVKATMEACRERWEELGGEYTGPRTIKEASTYEENLSATLWLLNKKYKAKIPTLAQLKATGPNDLATAVQHTHGYAEATFSFQPSPRDLFPFLILLYIYSQANTSGLRTLKLSSVFEIEGFGGRRVVMWFSKRRGTDYSRSFALDPSDELSPDSILTFIRQWTKRIRADAGVYKDILFIFVNKNGVILPFAASSLPGLTDSCIHWRSALKDFCKDHDIPWFVIRALRMTGLQVIRERSNDDLLAIKTASGTSGENVIISHYEGPDADLQRSEALSQGMNNQARWITSNGRIHQRGNNPAEDLDAATPGWNCLNQYQSPRPGQRPYRACDAYGECPGCPNGVLNTGSPYAFARCVQLRNEIVKAFDYLDYNRWKAVFAPIAERLDEFWFPQFPENVVAAARLLNLDDFGELT